MVDIIPGIEKIVHKMKICGFSQYYFFFLFSFEQYLLRSQQLRRVRSSLRPIWMYLYPFVIGDFSWHCHYGSDWLGVTLREAEDCLPLFSGCRYPMIPALVSHLYSYQLGTAGLYRTCIYNLYLSLYVIVHKFYILCSSIGEHDDTHIVYIYAHHELCVTFNLTHRSVLAMYPASRSSSSRTR